jgi:hypothetical protein
MFYILTAIAAIVFALQVWGLRFKRCILLYSCDLVVRLSLDRHRSSMVQRSRGTVWFLLLIGLTIQEPV